MPFVPSPQISQIDIRYVLLGQKVQNTIYARTPAAVGDSIAEDFAALIDAAFTTSVKGIVPTAMALTEVNVIDLSEVDSWARTVPITPPNQGTASGPALPSSNTLALSFRTNARGRSARGRNFLIGLTEGSVVGNTVEQFWIDGWVGFYQQIYDGLLTLTCEHVVLSRISDGVERPSGVSYAVTDYVVTDSVVDSQRRRLPGRGS